MKIETFFNSIVRPQYQVILLIGTLLIIAMLGWRALNRFYPLEKAIAIETVTPEKIKEWGGDPVVVDVGLYISNWYQFNIVTNEFIFDGVVWFQFDPALIGIDTIGKFDFQKGELLQKSAPDTKLIKGKVFAEYKIRLKFTATLSAQLFPLDDHRISFSLVNTQVAPSELIFRSYKTSFEMSDKVIIPDWRLVDQAVFTGFEKERYDKFDEEKEVRFPSVVFSLDFTRSGIRLILLILLPMFLIFFISLFWVAFEPSEGRSIFSFSTAAVASLIAYQFVIQNLSPKGGSFLLSDHIFTLFLSLAFLSFVLSLLWVRYGKMTRGFIIMRGSLFLFIHVLIISVWYYVLFLWL